MDDNFTPNENETTDIVTANTLSGNCSQQCECNDYEVPTRRECHSCNNIGIDYEELYYVTKFKKCEEYCCAKKGKGCDCEDNYRQDCGCKEEYKPNCCKEERKPDCCCKEERKPDCCCKEERKPDCCCKEERKPDCCCEEERKHDCCCKEERKHDCCCKEECKPDCGCKEKKCYYPPTKSCLKCGNSGGVTIPLGTLAGTSFTLTSLSVQTSKFDKPCISFSFASNIVATAALLSIDFQVVKQCRCQFNSIPVGPTWTFSNLVTAISVSDTFSFDVCDCDSCMEDCCTYSVIATVTGIATVGTVAINNATLSALIVDNKTHCNC